jgi:hypothetical protein
MSAIKAAYRKVFDTNLEQLSYVLINKNPRKPIATPSVKTEPRTDLMTEKDDTSAKYMYRLFDNGGDSQLDARKFEETVSTIFERLPSAFITNHLTDRYPEPKLTVRRSRLHRPTRTLRA